MTEGASRMSIPDLSPTLLQAEHNYSVSMVVAHTCCAQNPIQDCSAPVADNLWMLHSQSGVSRLFWAFLFLPLQAVWLTPLPQVLLLLVHLNKSPLRISSFKLSLWPGHTGQADLVLVRHGFPVWKRCPFVFLFETPRM